MLICEKCIFTNTLTILNTEVEVFWTVTSCSDVAGCQRSGAPCCFHVAGSEGSRSGRRENLESRMEFCEGSVIVMFSEIP